MSDTNKEQHEHHEHHVLSNAITMRVFIFLLIFTVITVAASRFDFGSWNFAVAMLIATVKAMAVILYFMGLKYDANDNRIIFATSFAFVLVFLALTATDLFSRGDWKVTGSPLKTATGGPTFEEPWNKTDELVAYGKEIYVEQACYTCHGDEGRGNGPAGAALNPPPRNFHETEGWKNGRNPAQVFKTLTEGLNLMPAYSTLTPSARWAVAHYVLSLGPEAPEVTNEDLAAIGIDPDAGSTPVQPTIPIDFAMELYVEP